MVYCELLILRKHHCFVLECSKPSICCPGLVPHHLPCRHGISENSLGIVWIAPHVSNKGVFCYFDTPTAKPNPQRLVNVLTTPSNHVLIVAFCLFPPFFADCQKASTHQWDISSWISQPCEVCTPEDITSPAVGPIWNLLPSVRIQRGNCRHNDCSMVPRPFHLLEEGILPPISRLNVAVKKDNDITFSSVTSCFFCGDQSKCLVMTKNPDRWRTAQE
mmetsp:Transcript_31087/g.61020  ORF Transcript_31087/g.61020 Transcript_31087/m.61020 type:complete len:218 (-) Transcript_31087:677-1330(-)